METNKISPKTIKNLISTIIVLLLILVGKLAYPEATKVVLNVLWFFLLSVVIIFVTMGILVILGLRDEVKKMLDAFLEGSFTILDIFRVIKQILILFKLRLMEFLLDISPLFSYLLGLCVYLIAIYIYKLVGRYYDVTIMTIIFTVVLVVSVGIVNLKRQGDLVKTDWLSRFLKRIQNSFADALEVVVFAFFLTMDSTNLFYMPANLNILLKAQIGTYDLMVRGYQLTAIRTTITIVIASIITEILRNILKLIAVAKVHYSELLRTGPVSENPEMAKYQRIKMAIQSSFNQSKDELMKFITFTSVMLFVFLLFPRLKIFSLAIGSITGLILDLIFAKRLTAEKSDDLLSRVLSKIFRL